MNYSGRLIAAALLLLPASIPARAADAFGYSATSNTPFSYLDVSATGASILSGEDDASAVLSLPFTFHFYGVAYTNLCVSTNGLISFGFCVASDFTNLDLTAQSPPGNQPLIAPFWSDLSFAPPGAGSVVYKTLGTAPNRQFVIQWNNASALNLPGLLNFEAILFETTDNIVFQYASVETGSATVSKGGAATVGIRGASGNSNGDRTQWSFDVPVLVNGMAVKFISSIPVTIDIRPGETPNTINLKSNGQISVAIYSSAAIDVTRADPSTITMAGASVAKNPQGLFLTSIADLNGDGLPDLQVQFNTQNLQLSTTDTQATLTGRTTDGRNFRGSDSIVVIK